MTQQQDTTLELDTDDDQPVTVSVSRRVRLGREQEYEEWLRGIARAALEFPGYMGANVLRPCNATRGEYVTIYRFDSFNSARTWEESDIRAEWLAKVDDLVEGESTRRKVTGLEFWFDLPSVAVTLVPSRHKMAIVLIVVVYTLVLTLGTLMQPVLEGFPFWKKLLLIIPLQVVLMTYLVMPAITRLLKNWIYHEA